MKKLFLAIAAVAMVFATSCQKENTNAPEEPAVAGENEFICVIDQNASQQNAPAVNDNKGTLAHIDGNNNVWWQEGDKIAYYGKTVGGEDDANFGRYELTCSKLSNNSAYFSIEGMHFYSGAHEAYYPASIMHLDDQGQKVLTLQPTINLEAGKNAGQLPMYGTGNGTHYLTFHNICAVLKIAIPSSITTCNQIVLSATEPIAGPFTMNGTKAVLANSGTSTTLTVNAPSGTTFSGTVYVAIPEGTYHYFAVRLLDGTNNSLDYRVNSAAMSVSSNKMYPVTLNPMNEPSDDIFHFTAPKSNGTKTVTIRMDREKQGDFTYSNLSYFKTGMSQWEQYTFTDNGQSGQQYQATGQEITLEAGEKLYIKNSYTGDNTQMPISGWCTSASSTAHSYFVTSGEGDVEVSGKVMYLLNGSQSYVDAYTGPTSNYSLCELFWSGSGTSCPNLTDITGLVIPTTTLTKACYQCMFRNCTNLRYNGDLVFGSGMAELCYNSMFLGCENFNPTSIEMQSTTVRKQCYSFMFHSCKKLACPVTIGVTEAINSENQSYALNAMFYNCYKLSNVTLKASALVDNNNIFASWLINAGTDASVTSRTVHFKSSVSTTEANSILNPDHRAGDANHTWSAAFDVQ